MSEDIYLTERSLLSQRLGVIEERIQKACVKSGRSRSDIILIAVTKTHPVKTVLESYQCGIRYFGENRIQEMKLKAEELQLPDIKWQLIGHLQKNKIKQAIQYSSLIHSVDTYELAKEIDKEAKIAGKNVDILLEVNIAGERTKFGFSEEGLKSLINQIALLEHVHVKGLMTIAPYTENDENNRIYFKRMKQLFIDISNKNIDNISMDTLSMGMSCDFEPAIEEGATMVRIGTAIYGER
jgi:PLP dependent protein